jgi:hypothetical protein
MYHSEKVITNFTLKVNEKTKFKISGISSEQVETGALLNTINEERRAFFAYSAGIAYVVTVLLIPISSFLFILNLAIIGPNIGSGLCMLFVVSIFIGQSLEKKARQCNFISEPVVFTKKDILYSVFKASLLVTTIMAFLLWTIS